MKPLNLPIWRAQRRHAWLLAGSLMLVILSPANGAAQCRIYYSGTPAYSSKSIGRMRLHGEKPQTIVSRGSITALGIDEPTGDYLWSEIGPPDNYLAELHRGNFSGGLGTPVLKTEYRGQVTAITYSPDQRSIFFRIGSQVYRFDGATAQPLFPPWIDAGPGGGLARDPATGRFYFGGSWGISVTEADGSGGSTVPGVPINAPPGVVLFNPAEGLLYYTNPSGEVYRISKGGGIPQLVVTHVQYSALTADFTENRLYWIDDTGSALLQSDLNGNNITILRSGFSGIKSIAYSKTAGRFAFASGYEVFSAALDGSDLQTVNSVPAIPEDPELNEQDERIYFISKPGKAIFRAAVDGSSLERIAYSLGQPEGLALDSAGGFLYWGDSDRGTISRSRLDGTEQTVLLSGIGPITDLALDRVQAKLYWSETSSGIGKIRKTSLATPAIEELLSNLGNIPAIDVDDNTEAVYWAEAADDSYIKRRRVGEADGQTIITLPSFDIQHPRFGLMRYPATPYDFKFSEELGRIFLSKAFNMNTLSVFESYGWDGSNREILVGWYGFYGEFALASSSIGPCDIGYDDDGLSDLAVFRPETGSWFIRPSSPGTLAQEREIQNIFRQWGLPGDLPVQADYDGDGKLDLAVWRPTTGIWHVCYSADKFNCSKGSATQFGVKGDYPLVGTFDNDEKDDFAVWRPYGPGLEGQWFIRRTAIGYYDSTSSIQWGLKGDIPLLADFDGDGISDLTVWRPSNGTWYIAPSDEVPYLYFQGAPPIVKQWGLPGDHPLAGDFDGDGRADLIVWRPTEARWYICSSKSKFDCSQGYSVQFGLPGDHPITADFDGDSILDLTVWRPSLPPVVGQWYYKRSSDGLIISGQWGLKNDIPLGLGSKGLRGFLR